MATLNPYLNFNGNCEEAFNFYKSAFGGEFPMIMRFKDVPPGAGAPKDDNPNWIMHIALPIGKSTILMGSDSPSSYGKVTFGASVQISISAESRQEADKLFNALSAGGKVTVPMADAFWGSYFGMFTDKFGIHWMVSHDKNRGN
jgi:PhnB protein